MSNDAYRSNRIDTGAYAHFDEPLNGDLHTVVPELVGAGARETQNYHIAWFFPGRRTASESGLHCDPGPGGADSRSRYLLP